MPDIPEPKKSFKETVKDFLFINIRYGIGCAWIGRTYTDQPQMKKDLEVLETAYRLGFRYFDTSAAYGMSEKVVGEFTAVIPRDSIFLATKSRLPEPGNPKAAADAMRRSLEESLRRLHTDRLDLFQIHDVDTLSDILAAGGVLELLVNLRQQGTIRYIGLATRWHNLLEQAAQNGAFDTILTYRDYNLVDQSAAPLIQTAYALRVGVINASPLGAIQSAGMDLRDEEVLAAALQYPLQNPQIDITLTGPANVDEVISSARALQRPVDWARWNGPDRV